WNDGVILGHISEKNHDEIIKNGESVLNAAMASYAIKLFGEMLDFIGDIDNSKKAIQYASNQRQNVHVQWNGKWFKRAWLTEDIGWIGEDQLWLEPQPWAIIGGAVDSDQMRILVESIDKLVRQPSKIGARLLSKGINAMKRELGMRVNGGVWPSINGTLIWALSLVNRNMAWDEWKKNTLAFHAENYPEVWYGIWSGPDVYNSDLSKYPGQTHFSEDLISSNKKEGEPIYDETFGVNWTDFPIMDLHPHAWPLYNTIHLIGAKFNSKGIELAPILPQNEFKFSSSILGFEKSKKGYSGWYTPLIEGTWKISLKLEKEEIKAVSSIKVNEKEDRVVIEDGKINFHGKSTPNKPLIWEVKLN
ncbi:MAG: GH36-type glycosyl hydrolase domain-containing protein, partial [Candidatus Hodarchaeota archaeon]